MQAGPQSNQARTPSFSEENLTYLRIVLLLQGIMYPLWWLTSYKYSPHLLHLDPLMSRVAVGLVSLSFLGLTYAHSFFRKHAYLLMIASCWLISFHYMNVVRLSQLAPMRIFGMFQIISYLFTALLTLRSVAAYGAFMIGVSIWVAQTPSDFPGRVIPPALFLLTFIMYLSLRVRVRLIESLTQSRKSIRDILDNVPTGFVAIRRNGLIEEGFSTASTQLFNQTSLAGKPLSQVIGVSPSEEESKFKPFLDLAFGGQIAFRDAAQLAPALVNYGNIPNVNPGAAPDPRYVTLEYHPSYRSDGKSEGDSNGKVLEKIVVVATDRTLEKELEREVKRQQERIIAVGKILDWRSGFIELAQNIQEFTQSPPSQPSELIRALHTQKGHAHLFSLTELGEFAHRLEDLAKQENGVSQVYALLAEYQEILKKFLSENESILGEISAEISAENLSGASLRSERRVNRKQVEKLASSLLRELKPESPVMQDLLRTLYWNHPKEGLQHYQNTVQAIAERQGKEVTSLFTGAEDLWVDLEPYRPFFASCVHLFRNAVDHGIEPKEDRKAAGKPLHGTIECRFQQLRAENQFSIEVRDDGCGVNLARVKEIAIAKGLLPAEKAQRLRDEEALLLLFLPGFSTRSEVTELSGRGAGLDAVKWEAERLGGSISIDSRPGEGTCIRVLLPLIDGISQIRPQG
jgi:two-component system chemotaxis sensor kinase CheA